MAWETDGASAANRIAKHAIQAAKRRVILFISMPKLYQAYNTWDAALMRNDVPAFRCDSLCWENWRDLNDDTISAASNILMPILILTRPELWLSSRECS